MSGTLEIFAVSNLLFTVGVILLGVGLYYGISRIIRKAGRLDNIKTLVELDALFKVCDKKGLDPERALCMARILEGMEQYEFTNKKDKDDRTFRDMLQEYTIKELEGDKK